MITEAELSHDDMKQAEAKGYLCPKCQGKLTVAWGGAHGVNGWILRCSDITHTGMTRHDKKYENEKKESFSMDSKSLMTMDEDTMLQRVEMARFPQQLDTQGKLMLAKVAITYGFDPLMGEVMIYQGRPFVSIDGRYRMAQETGNLDGVESRPANKQEREDWEIPAGDYFFRAEVYVKGASRPFVGWGRVRTDEQGKSKGFAPIDTNPQRMAEKRAEAQALRKAFHIPLPSAEDIGTAEDMPAAKVRVVDVTTGEIKEPEPPEPASKKEPTPGQKLAAAIKKTGYTNDEVKAHMVKAYGRENSKDLTLDEMKELTSDVLNYQVTKAQPVSEAQEELFPEDKEES